MSIPAPKSVNISGLTFCIDFKKNFRMGEPKKITTIDDISTWISTLYGIFECPMDRKCRGIDKRRDRKE